MNFITKLIYRFFKNEIENEVISQVRQQKEASVTLKQESELTYSKHLIGHPVICVSNEWKNPVIGFVTEIKLVSKALCPLPVIYDELTGTSLICFGVVYEYTEQRMNALLTLDPFERWSLMIKYSHDTFSQDKYLTEDKPKLMSLYEVRDHLYEKGFFNRVKLFMEKENARDQ